MAVPLEPAISKPQAIAPLLDPDEPAPVLVERARSSAPVVFVADHAGPRLPRRLGDLGLGAFDLERHIAYDIGILPVAQALARAFDAPFVAQTYSRLVIDCNRPTHVAQSIPEISELTPIPGNLELPDAARRARIEALFRPYHATIEALLEARARAGLRTVLVAMHSFTPVYKGTPRP
jgi:predicted N-formylglutamate amidohydrolase